MTIYHFCNDRFGRPFAPVSAAFAKEHGVRIVRVLSVGPERGSLRSMYRAARRSAGGVVRRAQRLIEGASPHGDDLLTLYTSDVNAPSFNGRIRSRDVAVITGFDHIFSAETIARFESIVNLHPSILPLYRGRAPTYWCIRNQERSTGFTLHKVTPKIDSGEPLYQQIVPIDGETVVLALTLKVARAALPIFHRYLEHVTFGGEWVPRYVDAYKVYQTHLNYGKIPDKPIMHQADEERSPA